MSAVIWAKTIVDAARFAISQAKALGLPELLPDEIDKVKAAVNDALDEVLPLAIVGVAVSAVAVAEEKADQIASLGTSPTCPACGGVATQHVAHSPHTGKSEVTLSCDACGWKST